MSKNYQSIDKNSMPDGLFAILGDRLTEQCDEFNAEVDADEAKLTAAGYDGEATLAKLLNWSEMFRESTQFTARLLQLAMDERDLNAAIMHEHIDNYLHDTFALMEEIQTKSGVNRMVVMPSEFREKLKAMNHRVTTAIREGTEMPAVEEYMALSKQVSAYYKAVHEKASAEVSEVN